jgi:hypothetical protein
MDANQNGLLEEEEVGDGGRRRMVEFMIQRAGMEPKYPISIKQMQEALKKRSQSDGDRGRGSGPGASERDGERSRSAEKPLVVGFGVKTNQPAVPGFGKSDDKSNPAARSPSQSAPRTAAKSSSSGASSSDIDRKSREYARSLLNQHDQNKNGVLEENEWRGMKQRHWGADRDGNKVITLDELNRRVIEYSRGDSGGGRSSGSSVSHRSRSSSRLGGSSGRRTYRFHTPTERLPEGLPGWFARQDADGDGQVSMAEYSSYWSDSKAAEFVGLDQDNDGLITPHECLNGKQRE